jgi:hypothetical protein
MSKSMPPSKGSKRLVLGGRAGRAPGRGFGSGTTTSGKAGAGARPPKGFGGKQLGGRPPKGPGK